MFANKVVLVTGGSSGIGAATVELFAKQGASVAFVGRNEAKLKDVAETCHKYGAKTLAIKADVSKDREAKTIVKQTVDAFGKLDILVNNAGILRYADIQDPNLVENFDEIINTNLRPMLLISNLAAPHLIATKGNIVNVSSVASTWVKMPGSIAYNISKAGVDQFTKLAAMELAPSGVRVNAVNPGPVRTNIAESSNMPMPENVNLEELVSGMTALNKPADAEEIGELILYLASNKARSVTGSCYLIDNGILLK